MCRLLFFCLLLEARRPENFINPVKKTCRIEIMSTFVRFFNIVND
jgi:hypothetical protein